MEILIITETLSIMYPGDGVKLHLILWNVEYLIAITQVHFDLE